MKNHAFSLAMAGVILSFGAGAFIAAGAGVIGMSLAVSATAGLMSGVILTNGFPAKKLGYKFKSNTFYAGVLGGMALALAVGSATSDAQEDVSQELSHAYESNSYAKRDLAGGIELFNLSCDPIGQIFNKTSSGPNSLGNEVCSTAIARVDQSTDSIRQVIKKSL